MKILHSFSILQPAALCAVLVTSVLSPGYAADKPESASSSSSTTTSTNRSVSTVSTFTIPNSLAQGRDPFYPQSTRFISTPVVTNAVGPVVLEFKGLSGTPDRPLAIINNRTFAVGEEQDVHTDQGRVSVTCLAIEGLKVRVRAQGQTHELSLRTDI